MIPVSETPRSLSSSQFRFHVEERYLKFVSVDCHVPKIDASLIFLWRLFASSEDLTTTSERLQNSLSRKIISEHGFVPKS